MKICHIVDNLNIGGLERTIVAIVLGLKSYEHEVWCLKKKSVLAKDIEDSGIEIREFNFEGGLNILSVNKLASELRKGRFDIVHNHGIFPFMWGEPAAILAGIPARIVHCQNVYDDVVGKNRLKFRIFAYFTKKIIAVSEAVKRSLTDHIGIDPDKIVVIYNSSADMSAQDARIRGTIRQDLGLGDSFVIGSVGRVEKHKGHSFLIEAISKCKESGADCRGIIVGDGPERENLKAEIHRLGLDGAVIMPGWRRDIRDLLSAMDAFIQPSLLQEGLPLALAEAASAGLPLIATPIGGNPEIVGDGINGFIVPAGDPVALAEKIRYLMENSREVARMGENSEKVWLEKFNLTRMLNEIDSLYKTLKR
jgi:glycosyltransferase involved in cell wall biosynthesis